MLATTSPPPTLTPKQFAILCFLISFWGEHGFPPSLRDVCDHFGISSPNGVACHLKALREKGYLPERASARKARGLVVPALLAGAKAAADEVLKRLGEASR